MALVSPIVTNGWHLCS